MHVKHVPTRSQHMLIAVMGEENPNKSIMFIWTSSRLLIVSSNMNGILSDLNVSETCPVFREWGLHLNMG